MKKIALLLVILALVLMAIPKGAPAGVFGGPPQSVGFVQANCGTVTNPGSSFTVSFSNQAPQLNDEVILFLVNNTNGLTYNPGSQFVPIDADAGTNNANLNEFSYHIVGTAPLDPGSYTINPSSGGGETGWCLVEYTGIVLLTPVSIHGMKYTASGTSWTGPTLYPDLIPNTAITFYGIPGTDSATWTNGTGIHQRAYSTGWSLQVTDSEPGNLISNTSSATSSVSLGAGEVDTLVLRPAVGNEVTSYPIFEQGQCGLADSPNPLTVSLPAGPTQNDVLIVYIENNGLGAGGANTYTPPAGFTAIDSDSAVNNSFLSMYSYYHVAGLAESGSYTFTPLSTTRHHVWCIAEYENVNTSTPIDQHAVHYIAGPTTTWTNSALTATNQQETPISFFAPQGVLNVTWTNPANYAQRIFGGGVNTWAAQELEGPFTPVAGTVVAAQTATLSAAQGPGDVDSMLLSSAFIPPATPGATPTPPGTPTPSPTPPNSPYSYHGCSVYGGQGDWLTTDLTAGGNMLNGLGNTVDANSANIISNINTIMPKGNFNANSPSNDETVNLATNATTLKSVASLVNGWANDPANDDPCGPSPGTCSTTVQAPAPTVPLTSPFYQEGVVGTTVNVPAGHCTGDCHVIVLNTQTCVTIETFNSGNVNWNGTAYNTEAGYVHNLNNTFNSQYANDSFHGPTAGNTPLFGTTDWGEDASLSSINHVIGFFLSQRHIAERGNVPPATGGADSCTTGCTNPIPLGARLRLHSSYTCPNATSNPQANLVCNQLKKYGMILDDFTGLYCAAPCTSGSNGWGLRFGESSDGTTPWNGTDLSALLSVMKITDFDVMKLCADGTNNCF